MSAKKLICLKTNLKQNIIFGELTEREKPKFNVIVKKKNRFYRHWN